MDPLSAVLALIRIQYYRSATFTAGGRWAVEFPADESVRFYALLEGSCWLSGVGAAEPIQLVAGDCLLFPTGHPFRIGSDLTGPAINANTLFPAENDGRLVSYQGGGAVVGLGGLFTVDSQPGRWLLQSLPAVIHLPDGASSALLRWSLERLRQELSHPQAGSSLVGQHLAGLVLVETMRLLLTQPTHLGPGWLFGLTDRAISQALQAMHAQPAHRWTVEALADCASMSRTRFATRFRELVGQPPMDYLTHWRLTLACDQLAHSEEPIWEIAQMVGYESEGAFSTAFKRVLGHSPRQYRRACRVPEGCE